MNLACKDCKSGDFWMKDVKGKGMNERTVIIIITMKYVKNMLDIKWGVVKVILN